MKIFFFAVFVVGAGVVFSFASGCAGGKFRRVDVKAGEYYSEDEIAALNAKQRRKYCEELGAELAKYRQIVESKQREIERTRALADSTRRAIKPIEEEVLRLESDIRTVEQQIADVEALPRTWTVRAGETLSIIAGHDEIYNDIDKWPKIFEANKSKILDPYYIFPDTVLVIPRDWPTD